MFRDVDTLRHMMIVVTGIRLLSTGPCVGGTKGGQEIRDRGPLSPGKNVTRGFGCGGPLSPGIWAGGIFCILN